MIHLNNAAGSWPKPAAVIDAAISALRDSSTAPGRGGGSCDVNGCRIVASRFFGANDPKLTIFTSGATESLNLVIHGLPIDDGNVVTTANSHNAVLRPLYMARDCRNVKLDIVACDNLGRINPIDVVNAINSKTKAVVLTHANNVTGACLDLKPIVDVTQRLNIPLVLDASQSAGLIPINMVKQGIDILCVAGHKNLLGSPGTGLMILRDAGLIKPWKTGGTGISGLSEEPPIESPWRFEPGTPNLIGIAALRAGITEVESIGQTILYNRLSNLTSQVAEGLIKMNGIQVYYIPGSSVLACSHKDINPDDIALILEQNYGIMVRAGLHCAPLLHKYIGCPLGTLRISPGIFNTQKDIEMFLNAMKQIIENL